jgi:hypothetical protein
MDFENEFLLWDVLVNNQVKQQSHSRMYILM